MLCLQIRYTQNQSCKKKILMTYKYLIFNLSGWLGRYTNVEYLQSLYLKRQLLFQV